MDMSGLWTPNESESAPSGEDLVFIIRMWLERDVANNSGPLWRGRVTLVNTQAEKHVDGIEEAFDIVRATLPRTAGK